MIRRYWWALLRYLSATLSSTTTPRSCSNFGKDTKCKIPFSRENIFPLASGLVIYRGLLCELELVLWNYSWLGSELKCNHSNASILVIKIAGLLRMDILHLRELVNPITHLSISPSFFFIVPGQAIPKLAGVDGPIFLHFYIGIFIGFLKGFYQFPYFFQR